MRPAPSKTQCPWLTKYSRWIAIAAVLIASVRIVSTYWVFSNTYDEPAHIACGVEWLVTGTYKLEAQHPPLARIAVAIGPVLNGARPKNHAPDLFREGNAILFEDGKLKPGDGTYERYLASARAGVLPFFWLACAVIYLAAARWMGRGQATLAVLIFTLIPPILGHAGQATTDIPLLGTLALAFYAIARWMERPTPAAGAFIGLSIGLAVITKYSAIVYLPVCSGIAFGWLWWNGRAVVKKQHWISAAISAPVLILVVWGIFRFSWQDGTPAPEFWAGIRHVRDHQTIGNASYLLGERSQFGFWMFYPVSLAVKTPLAILMLIAGGLTMAWKGRSQAVWMVPMAGIAGVLAVGFYSRINIGLRHVMLIYCFAVLIAAGFAWEWLQSNNRKKHWLIGGLLFYAAASGAAKHPDYLAYFNEFAGHEPEKILVDSDLDWGQDLKRLAQRVKELRIDSLHFTPFARTDLNYFGFPPTLPSDPRLPSPGWNAVSVSMWKAFHMGARGEGAVWPDQAQPSERVGSSILLYYFPPAASATTDR